MLLTAHLTAPLTFTHISPPHPCSSLHTHNSHLSYSSHIKPSQKYLHLFFPHFPFVGWVGTGLGQEKRKKRKKPFLLFPFPFPPSPSLSLYGLYYLRISLPYNISYFPSPLIPSLSSVVLVLPGLCGCRFSVPCFAPCPTLPCLLPSVGTFPAP